MFTVVCCVAREVGPYDPSPGDGTGCKEAECSMMILQMGRQGFGGLLRKVAAIPERPAVVVEVGRRCSAADKRKTCKSSVSLDCDLQTNCARSPRGALLRVLLDRRQREAWGLETGAKVGIATTGHGSWRPETLGANLPLASTRRGDLLKAALIRISVC